jgi:GntR family transcriptional regulator
LDILSTDGSLSLHSQVQQRITRAISEGELVPGDLLPPEEELAIQARVSRTTVRHALGALVQSGHIVRKRGSGTRIAEPRISQELSALTGFAEDMFSAGLEPLAKVVSIRRVAAHDTVADQLRLADGSEIVRIERVRLGNGQPILFDVSYLPVAIGGQVAAEDLVHRPIYSLLEDDYGIALGQAEYRIQAISASRAVARHLQIARGAPLLLIERTTYTVDGFPIDYETLHYRGDRMSYFIRLKRNARRASLGLVKEAPSRLANWAEP